MTIVATVTEDAAAGSSTTAAGGTTLATTTTTAGVSTTIYTAEGAALNAGFTAAASQAAVTLANNKGDISKTLSDMGKSDSIKNIITSAVTAGALQNINPDWMKQLSNTGQFTDKAVINLTNAAVSATIKTAIQGGSYEANLTASLKTAGVDTVAGWAASNIGQGYKNGDGALSELQGQYIAHKVAHALVGCASAAAKDTSCAAGAMGGAVGEAFAEMYGQNKYGTADGATLTAEQQQEVLNMSKLVTAAVAGLTGKDAQAAVDAAQNAVVNNALSRQQANVLRNNINACAGEPQCVNDAVHNAVLLSGKQGNSIEEANAKQTVQILAQLAGDPSLPISPENRNAIATLASKNITDYGVPNIPNSGQAAIGRDKLTGAPVDASGRYTESAVIDGKSYEPKYFSCATLDCVTSRSNLDMNDAGTQAYVKALDQQVFKDIGTGATAGTLVTPVGVAANVLFGLGIGASIGQSATSDEKWSTARDEFLKAVSEKGGEKFFTAVLGHTPSAAARATALINLSGGWDAFVNRVKIDLFGVTK